MNCIMHFEHRSRLSWNRDFLSLDDRTGCVSSVRLNVFARIVRITLGGLASLFEINAFYSSTIITQKRISAFEQTKDVDVADDVEALVSVINGYGKQILYTYPKFEPAVDKSEDIAVFFGEQLPLISFETAEAILSYLPLKDLLSMRRVSTTWNQYIKSNNRIFCTVIIPTAFRIALQMPLSTVERQYEVVRSIASILKIAVKCDLELTKKISSEAKKIAQQMERFSQTLLLCELVKIEALYDIPAAKNTAEAIDDMDEFLKQDAFFHVALYGEHNFAEAREMVQTLPNFLRESKLEELVRELAKIDPVRANDVVHTIDDPGARARAELSIVKAELADKSPHAYTKIEQMSDPYWRYQAELLVAKQDKPHDFSKSVESAKQIADRGLRNLALANIVDAQSTFDIEGAKVTASLIDIGQFQRVRADYKIYTVQASRDKTLAIQWLTGPSDDFLCKINWLTFLAERNIFDAYHAALTFRDSETQVIALTVLARLVVK